MTISRNKRMAWWLMSGGFGAALLFALAVLMKGDLPGSREWGVYLWPLGGLASGAAGWAWLKRLFRAEPPVPPAAWTVSLSDLLLGMFCAGLFSALMQGLGRDFEKLVPVMGVLGLAFYIHGALAASLRGLFAPLQRALFVFAHVLLTLGAMGALTIVLSMFIVTFLLPGSPSPSDGLRLFRDVVLAADRGNEITMMIRICVYALPFGWAMMRVQRAWESRAAPPANG